MQQKPYTQEVQKALQIAQKIGKEHIHAHYSGAHLLKAMLNRDLSLLKSLEAKGIDVFYLEEWAEVRLEELPKSTHTYSCEPDEVIDTIFTEANQVAESLLEEEISLFAVMVAISSPGVAFSFDQMKTFPVSRAELLKDQTVSGTIFSNNTPDEPPVKKKNNFLQKYCIHKNAQVKPPKEKDLLVGRDTEINKIIEILCRFNKPNVLVIGDSGVGKTAVLEGFVQKVVWQQIPELLMGLEVFELDMGAIVAGASYKGEIEDRLKNIAQELKALPKAVLIIEEIHSILGGQGSDSSIANLLKSELSKGLRLIATSTIEEYTKKIEKEQGLSGMFELLRLEESDDDTHFRMLKQALADYQKHHNISIDDLTIKEAIRLSKRFMKERSLPASAIDLIDQTMASLKTAGESFLKERNYFIGKVLELRENKKLLSEKDRQLLAQWLYKDLCQKLQNLSGSESETQDNTTLTENTPTDELLDLCRSLIDRIEDIAKEKRSHITQYDLAFIISQKTNIPIGKLKEEEKQRLNDMENVLAQRVVGQDHAIEIVSEAILESRSGLNKAGQPIGSFFFLGPTGTGKTELAKSLAEFLFQDENAIIRFDMSEFKEEHSAALLYGAPPGYVGYEEGGLLVNKIRQKPYAIVLFDEIEKAHPDVFNILLQVLDDGRLTDNKGRTVNFKNTIIIMTSNMGSNLIQQKMATINDENREEVIVDTKYEVMEMLKKTIRPEFLNRIDETIMFLPLNKEEIAQVVELQLNSVKKMLTAQGFDLQWTSKAVDFLTEVGYDPEFGARPVKRAIQRYVLNDLSKKILSEAVLRDKPILIDANEDELIFSNK